MYGEDLRRLAAHIRQHGWFAQFDNELCPKLFAEPSRVKSFAGLTYKFRGLNVQ